MEKSGCGCFISFIEVVYLFIWYKVKLDDFFCIELFLLELFYFGLI